MLALGIDPGLERTGYGLVAEENGRLLVREYGVIRTPRTEGLPGRLQLLFAEMNRLIERFRPDSMAVEELFFRQNVTTAFAVGQARGVIVLAAAERNLPFFEYTPAQVKQAVTGYGRAEKVQIGRGVQLLLGLSGVPRPDDAADALSVAICHLSHYRLEAYR